MSISKYISDTKYIGHNQEIIFNYLSNFENLAKFINGGLLEKISEQIPQIKITDFESDYDSCRFNISGMGQAEFKVIKREPHQTIKVASSGSLPVGITFWVQLLPINAYQTKMRLTLHAEMSMMIKMMAGKKLEEGVNRMADMLAQLPYQ